MDERNNDFDFDFMPIGQAIKKASETRGMTREQLSEIIGYAPRHIQAIENEGKYPSIELFIQLIQMFDVSVDEYIFPDKEVKKSSVRRRLDAQVGGGTGCREAQDAFPAQANPRKPTAMPRT